MDFGDLTRVILRRWYVAVPLLLLTIAGAVLTLVTVKPNYVLTSYVQLVPPTSDAQSTQSGQGGKPRNPWNVLGLSALSQAAMYATQDQTFLDDLQSHGDSNQFTMSVGYPNPVVTIEVTAATQIQAEQTIDRIVGHYQQVVSSLQAQYPVKSQDMITTRRLDQGENIKSSSGKAKKLVVLAGGAGALMTLALTLAVDAVLRRRQRRREEPAAPVASLSPRAPGHAAPADGARPGAGERQPVPARADLVAQPNRTAGVEYRSGAADGEPYRDRPEAPAAVRDSHERNGQPSPMPPDATIVLAIPKWTDDGDRGKRR